MKSSLVVVSFAFLPVCFACNPSTPDGGDGGGADSAPVNLCKPATGAGVKHADTISADETWKATDGPHVVSFGIKVAKGATLTIEPCAEVRVQKGYSIVVEGNLVAQGTANNPIAIGADDSAAPWGFLQVFAPGTIKLAYATVKDGGGETTNAYGMIEARGDQLMPAQEILTLDHVTVSGSASYGVSLRAGGALTAASTALTITKSKAPMRIVPRLATNIPTGTYVGNTEDAIIVETEAYGEVNYEDVTYHDRGVPYRIGADVTLGSFWVGPNAFTLNMEPGVKFMFKKDGVLLAKESAGTTGVIAAHGTADKPIVFTSSSASPAPGDWVGIQFGKIADSNYALDHVEIRYAGGDSQSSGHHCYNGMQVKDDAALAIYHQPAKSLITNSIIADSKSDGVNNAYAGSFVDARPSNTFTGIAGCQVTQPLPTMGVCPSMGCP